MNRPAHTFLVAALVVGFLIPTHVRAQGGPPFRTDDPETPGARQWEINLAAIGNRNPSEGSYSVPNVDFNYGLGERIQLKYELPLSIQESREGQHHIAAGLGNSLTGVKWRFYERKAPPASDKISFAFSVYPQLVLNNPTRSLSRGIVEPGPQFLLPLEANATVGAVRIVAEVGYWFTTQDLPNSWVAGLLAGHEFKNATEIYLEFHNQVEVGGSARETTLGVGGRQPVARQGKVLLMGMLGRSLRSATISNGQPDWIAYLGLQFRFGSGKKETQLRN